MSNASGTPKAASKVIKQVKPEGCKARERRPFIPPGEPAPNHRGKPDASGQLYPGLASLSHCCKSSGPMSESP